MKTEYLWAVYTNTDLTEGRGRQYVKHFCKLEATARRLAKHGYVQGSDCPVDQVPVVVLEGRRLLAASLLKIEEPTPDDEKNQTVLNVRDHARRRAFQLGMTPEEILALSIRP